MSTTNQQATTASEISDDIKKVIEESLEYKLEEKRKILSKKELNEVLTSTLQEFMKCFTLVGYDLNNEPVVIVNASDRMNGEALSSLTKRAVLDVFVKPTIQQ